MVRQVSATRPDTTVIAEAAAVLRRGGLVAFPTETVYGLGANALDAAAVQQIFAAKGRPANNPIIVHVADAVAAEQLAAHWPEGAAQLAAQFWPGALTLVLPKRPEVPEIVSAGGPTVGLRVPGHRVALALLESAGIPIAAPSANRSTAVSPTTAEHVLGGLDGRVDLILDAGPTEGGLESTVLDLTVDPPRVLRPGLVTVRQLQEVIGQVAIADRWVTHGPNSEEPAAEPSEEPAEKPLQEPFAEPLRSPGMLARHYAPRAKVICIDKENETRMLEKLARGSSLGWLRLPGRPAREFSEAANIKVIEMPPDATGYAARLYAALHELDGAGVEYIVVDSPPHDDAWLAIHDRLRRAAHTE